jgi:DNA polymerase I-like protein with 3'-5' exonuclease and polymerase domains
LGKPIPMTKIKSSFNAIIQGSIAEAMQCVIAKIGSLNSDIILAEIHDSLVLVSTRQSVSTIIDIGKTAMMRPFKGILQNDPIFPVKVSVGNKWRQWRYFKTYKTYDVH